MDQSQFKSSDPARIPHRFRYLIDIIALVAVTFLLDIVIETFVQLPVNMRTGFVFDAIGKLFLIAVGWGLLRLRGEQLADIGLKRPKSWGQTFLIGIVYAAVVFAAMYFSEKAGYRRDLSKFNAIHRNLELTIYAVGYAFIGAGLYEEFMFRGFLMQGLAMCFGASRGAWVAACVIQAMLFGAAHAYQNPLGMLITGGLGLLMGVIVLASGRNLWPVIIGHGLYDASRFVLFYFQGPPSG